MGGDNLNERSNPIYRYLGLTLGMLGKTFSRRHFEIFFLFFLENWT